MKSWFLKWGLLTVLVFAGQNDKTLSFETSEGTLISVDVSPNGARLDFLRRHSKGRMNFNF